MTAPLAKLRSIWREETRTVANEVSNARDFCANERNFLTALRLTLILIAVSSALFLKFRFVGNYVDGDETGVTSEAGQQYSNDLLDLLGLSLPSEQSTASNSSVPTPLLETNRVAIPLGVLTFILALFLLIVNTYSYASTNGQLRRGDAFAGHLRLSAAVNAILALLLLAAVISFLVVQRI